MFKLLAIRPLEGCAQHIQKCLKTDMMYYFCNDYIIEPGSHIRRRSKNIKPLKEDFFTLVSESDYSEDNSSKEKSPTISVSAIVGMNGDGKSTLVELMMRLINNCAISYKLYVSSDNSNGEHNAEVHYNLRRVKEVRAELYYMVDNVVYRMAEENENDGTRIWRIADLNPINEKGEESMRWNVFPVEIKSVDEDPKCFFFTIVSNYSHYAYNVYDYQKEWEVRDGDKDDDEKCWLHYIFHKNDGYLTPITLHPYRYKGNIDINVEKELSKQRLLSLFLNADKPTDVKPTFRRVNGKDANVLKLTEESESKLQQRAIIEFFKATNEENKYDLIIKEIDGVESRIDKATSLMDSNLDYLYYFKELVDRTLPYYFVNPIYQIFKQYGFADFVSGVINWLKTTDKSFFHDIGNIGAVLEKYENLVKKNNKYIQALTFNNWGINYDSKGEFDKAISEYDKVLELNFLFAEVINNKGNVYFNKGEFDKAIEEYNKAIELKPKFAEIYNNRGNAFFNLAEYDKAVIDYDKTIELDSKCPEAYFNRGNVYYKKGDFISAIMDYNKAIRLNPEYAEAYNNRGNAYFIAGMNYLNGIDVVDFEKAQTNPKYIEAIRKREKGYSNRGRDYELFNAWRDYNKAIELNPKNPDVYFNRGNYYFKVDDFVRAEEDYSHVIENNKIDAEAYCSRGNAHYKLYEYNNAIKDYYKALKINIHYAEAYNNRGNAYFEKGDYDKAIEDYNKAIGIGSMDAEAYYNRGNAYFEKGDYDKAIEDYNKAIVINTMDAEAFYNRGNAYFKKNEYDIAIKDYDKVIELLYKSEAKEAYYNRGYANYKQGNYEAAMKDYESSGNSWWSEIKFTYYDYVKECKGIKACKGLNSGKLIQIIRMVNTQKNKCLGKTDMEIIQRFQMNYKRKIQYPLQLISDYEFIRTINANQLGRLDTLYRIMEHNIIDWEIIVKDYNKLTIKEKCEQYKVYKIWSILDTYPQYQKAKEKDNKESLKECGEALEECVEMVIKDDSFITRKLRQVNNFMGEIRDNEGLYDRLGKRDDENHLLVDIDLLKKHYGEEFVSLDNLPPPVYKWDIVFQKKDNSNCEIEFDSFSSGEKQKLNSIGAIIYHLQNLNHTASKVKYKNVNLILEEIELYYHPEYQRQFFNELLARIKEAKLENIKNINIVFVTHSPFILSDIPKCNVLFLKEGVPKDIMQENTFGANIHTLLKNGFFIPNLPIGEFAYGKINKLFGKLNSGELDPNNDLDDIYQEILLVGEPFLRNQLLMLYNSFKGSRVMPMNTSKKGLSHD